MPKKSKLGEGKRMLESGKYDSIKEIAKELKYTSASNFARAFLSQYKHCPSDVFKRCPSDEDERLEKVAAIRTRKIIRLKKIAQSVAMCNSSLSIKFKEKYGESVIRYIKMKSQYDG